MIALFALACLGIGRPGPSGSAKGGFLLLLFFRSVLFLAYDVDLTEEKKPSKLSKKNKVFSQILSSNPLTKGVSRNTAQIPRCHLWRRTLKHGSCLMSYNFPVARESA